MAKIKNEQLKQIIEAAIFVHEQPLSIEKLQATVLNEFDLSKRKVKQLLKGIEGDYAAKGIRLVEVASGYRFQSDASLNPWVSRLWQESAPKYSRALMETLSLIAYRQPITRGEIEDVRGVSVSSHIIKTLQERDWVKVVGHKEVPGRPALLATTKTFLDYFSLTSLADLPSIELIEQSVANEDVELALTKQTILPSETNATQLATNQPEEQVSTAANNNAETEMAEAEASPSSDSNGSMSRQSELDIGPDHEQE